RRVGAADTSLRRARVVDDLGQRVLELRLAGLEPGRVDVGDVVAGDVEHRLVRPQAADAGEERTKHGRSPFRTCGLVRRPGWTGGLRRGWWCRSWWRRPWRGWSGCRPWHPCGASR